MRWSEAHAVVEHLRQETRLYLPGLSRRRGFSSDRVEHLLNGLVQWLPVGECYLEVGSLEGRTIEAAASGNTNKVLFACDPGAKYGSRPEGLPMQVKFLPMSWQEALAHCEWPIGAVFYDADHSAEETAKFMREAPPYLAKESVLVLDDWDRESVRAGAFQAAAEDSRWRLLREMPEYTDGLTCAPQRFGYFFGVSVWGFRA